LLIRTRRLCGAQDHGRRCWQLSRLQRM
jgi:hypothetical protein